MMKCFIIDDELSAVNLITLYINKTPGLELSGTATDPLNGVAQLKTLKPDLVFMDINMPEISGLAVAQLINNLTKPKIIFTTGYKKYAHKAFELDAIGYLIKPVNYEKFLQAVHKTEYQLKLERAGEVTTAQAESPLPEYYFFRSNKKSIPISPLSIDCIQSRDNYVEIVCGEEVLIIRNSLTEIVQQLHPDYFIRVSRFNVVPIRKIKQIT
jgi:DNA-binding LytR/AlgR family response regulator